MKHLIAILLLLALAAPVRAENPWADSPGAKEYPNASAIVLKDDISAVIHPDGTHDLIEYDAIKVLTKDGLERFGQTSRTYDASTQTLVVEVARMWRPDGTVVEVPKDKITDVVPPVLAKHPLYQRMRVVTIEYPDLTEGSVIEFQFKHHRKTPWPGRKFWEVSYTQDFEPILDTRFTFKSPENVPFEVATPGTPDLTPETMAREGGVLRMVWHLKDRPLLAQQPAMPPLRALASQIQVSSFQSWDDFAVWARALYDQAAQPSTAVNLKASSVVAGLQGDLPRIRALMAWVAREKPGPGGDIALEELPPATAGQALDAPSLTAPDQAVLLLSLLRAEGIKASPVLVASSDYGDAERGVPSLPQFNRLLLVAPGPEGLIWMDPTAGEPDVLGQGLMGRNALVLDSVPAKWVATPIATPQSNREEIQGVARLDPDGSLDVALKIREYGANAVVWRGMLGHLEEREQRNIMQMLATGINPTSVLRDFFLSKDAAGRPLEMTVGFEASQGAGRGRSGDYIMPIPVLPQRRLASYASVPQSERVYPVVLGATTYEERRVQIVIPDDWKIVSLPKTVTINNESGSFQVDVRAEGRSIWYYTRLILRRPEIPLADYAQFKTLMDAVEAAGNEVVTLTPGTPAANKP